MSFNEWKEVKLENVINFNPKESLKKGKVAKKVAMDKLDTFNRQIQGYEECEFKGGTKFRNGDTLLARITPCLENGKTAQVSILAKGEVGFGSTEFIVMREKETVTCNDYIYYLAISPEFRNIAIKSMTGTSGRQRVQGDVLQRSKIKLPPLQEQKAIANILSSLDEKIELNNQMNKTLEEMAQALFKRWFVDFEFPNENGEPYKSSGGEMVDSELGMIPKGYLIGTLDEMCKLSAGGDKPKNFSKFRSEEYKVPIYSNGIENEGLYGFTDEAKIFEKSVTVSARGTIGFICLRQLPYVPIVRLISVTPKKSDLSSEYVYHWIKGMNIQATGTTQQQLTVPQFKKSKILIPNTNIMNNFTMKVESMVAQIEANKLENENLLSIRDTLLPKLMSGEIRVADLQN